MVDIAMSGGRCDDAALIFRFNEATIDLRVTDSTRKRHREGPIACAIDVGVGWSQFLRNVTVSKFFYRRTAMGEQCLALMDLLDKLRAAAERFYQTLAMQMHIMRLDTGSGHDKVRWENFLRAVSGAA
ncbi:MAG TPA: hypothetical protein VJ654_20645 [Noviherbaspirillum sp.]|nr:hypothetical protein [Noviherbaspirillum sp.]